MTTRELTAQDEEILRAARALRAAEHGEKTALTRELAESLGISERTFRREIMKLKGARRERRKDAGKSKDEIIKIAAEKVAELRAKIVSEGEDVRRYSTETALKRLTMEGKIEAGAVSASAVNRKIRDMGITAKERTRRMDSKQANKVHLFDGSGSENFYPIEQLPDGDWLLGIRASTEKSQKNRRIKGSTSEHGARGEKENRRMVYYYGITDLHSRLLFVDMTVTAGENTRDSVHFLERAWSQKGDHPMVGLPDIFYTDSGPLARGREGSRLLRNLEICLEIHMPRKARAKGAIERPWRTLWQRFELDFVLSKGRTLRLSELKGMLTNYLNEYNSMKSPGFYADGKSRAEAYLESIAGREVRLLPEEKLVDLLYREEWRVIDFVGRVQWDGYFEIKDCAPELLGEKVLCLKNMRGEVVVQHPKTREWLKTRAFKPLEFGEEFRNFKKNINDEIMERAVELDTPEKFLYQEARGVSPYQEGLINMTKAREVKYDQFGEREKPEEAEGFLTEHDAIYFFTGIVGPLAHFPEAVRDTIKLALRQRMRDRKAVRELAINFKKVLEGCDVEVFIQQETSNDL